MCRPGFRQAELFAGICMMHTVVYCCPFSSAYWYFSCIDYTYICGCTAVYTGGPRGALRAKLAQQIQHSVCPLLPWVHPTQPTLHKVGLFSPIFFGVFGAWLLFVRGAKFFGATGIPTCMLHSIRGWKSYSSNCSQHPTSH